MVACVVRLEEGWAGSRQTRWFVTTR